MEWIEPVDVKSAVKFSSSLVNSTDEECRNIIHGSITDSNLAWFACGDRLDVVSTTHSGVQSRHFQCPQGQKFQITCVAPIPNENLALVGLSSNTGSGAVALYNYVTSMILNSWMVSHKVTCVCAMEIPNASYKQFFKSDCFLFALGTEEGHVMLLAIDQHFKFCAGTHQLELNSVHYVTTDDILQKRLCFKPPVVLVIPLNDSMFRAGKFVLESMHESNAVLNVPQEEVCATVVKYISQNQTLCVGYNTQGAFQMFSLKSLELDFSGLAQGCNGEKFDRILDFVFLEPEDDSRHFCYLAVVAQKSREAYAAPYALLYSLSYVIKEIVSEERILYEDLQNITLRLDLNFGPLIAPEGSGDENIELLTCQSLASSSSHGNPRATAGYGLCYFAMSWKDGVYLVIFDLNQWYQALMPPRWMLDDTSRMCPFMGFYQAQTPASARLVRQVWIQSPTLSIFHRSSSTPTEGFFYPSALSFRAVVVCPQEAEIVLFLGMQSFLLKKLSQAGSQVLNHPHQFYVQAMKAGLISTEIVAPHPTQMMEALLNIGLENNSRSFLVSCIKDVGANLNFVEKWAWQKVLNLKSLRENLCHFLFDHSTQDIEEQVQTQLYHVTHQFNNLAVLYDLMDKRIRSLNSGVNDKLRDKPRAIQLLSLHLETVLWFLHGGLLPEVDEEDVEDEESTNSLPYPRRKLEQFYRTRKMEIESLSSSVKASEVLLIEQLVPSSVVSLWAEERGTTNPKDIQTYPPPSLYALLSSYLRPDVDVDDVTKHRLVQYVFMDLTWIYGPRTNFGNILQHLMTFPSTYSLKPSVIKVTQAFWHLDHQNFDDALGMLLDPLVHTMDITNSQQRAILRSFLYQDKRRHALKYATLRQPVCPELEDIQLHLTILIANGLISDALSYIKRNRNQRNSVELMQHLLNGCQEMRKISVLLTLPLSDEEEEHVTNFLKRSRNIDLQEALLLFYIQRCKYPDAIAYSQRLNQMWPARDAISRERFNRREMLMQTLIGALPPITCKLAAIANSRPTTSSISSGVSKYPRPLSVAVLPATSKVQSTYSDFFRTVIEQSRATWLIEQKLCNIVQTVQRNITLGMSLCFPSHKGATDSSSMDITCVTELDTDVNHPKKGKRPRISSPKALAAFKTDAEVVSVLQTPPIRHSRPLHSSMTEVDGSSSSRPSSILKDKMRRFMRFSAFDTGGRPICDAKPSEFFVRTMDSNEEDEESESFRSMERSDEEKEPHIRKETLDDSSSSAATGANLVYSSVGKTSTTISTSQYKQRFTFSSTSSSAEEEEKPAIESDEDLQPQEMAAIRKPVGSDYNEVSNWTSKTKCTDGILVEETRPGLFRSCRPWFRLYWESRHEGKNEMWKSENRYQEPFELCGSKEGSKFLLSFQLITICPSDRSYTFNLIIQAKPDLDPVLVYPTRIWLDMDSATDHPQLLAVEDGTWQFTHTDTDIPFNITVWIDYGSNQEKDNVNDRLFDKFLNQTHFNFTFMFNDGQSVGAHAEILSAGSPVLSAMFQSSCVELNSRKMTIIDCDIQIFKQFLVFLYTNNAPLLSVKTTRDLFVLADKYLVVKLKEDCLNMMLTQVNLENVIDTLGWSQFYDARKLYERAMQFCVSHFRELCVLQEWTELEIVDNELFHRVHQQVADLLPENNGPADQQRAEPHLELANASFNSSIEEADVSASTTGTMLSVSDNSLEEERTLFEDQVTQEADLVVARDVSAPPSSIADVNSQSGQLSQKHSIFDLTESDSSSEMDEEKVQSPVKEQVEEVLPTRSSREYWLQKRDSRPPVKRRRHN